MFYEKAKPLGGTQLNYKVIDNKTEYPIGVKNLFWNFNLATGAASTSNGVSYTLNTNQTITMSGTATAQSYRTFAKRIPLIKGKTYTIKGIGVANNYRIILAAHSESAWVRDIAVSANANTTFTYTGLPEGATHVQAKVHVYNGTSVNATISPIMVEGTSVGDFEAYQSTVENLLHVKTDALITDHYFSYSEPNKTIENFYIFGGTTSPSDYTGGWSNGNASSTDTSKITCGTDGWIRTVEKIDVTNFDVIEAYLYIQQPYESEIYLALGDSYGYKYTGLRYYILTMPMSSATEGVYKTIEIDVSNITGTYYICLSHRGFGSSYWQYIKATGVVNGPPEGRVWIQNDLDKGPTGFNAIKRNEIMVYPYKLKQWNGSKWQPLDGILYKNGTSVQTYKKQIMLLKGQTLTNGVTAIDTRGSLNGNYGYNPLAVSSNGVNINTTTGNGNKRNSLMTLTPKINLTEYSTITFYFSTFSITSMKSGDSFRVGVTTSAASNLGDYAMRGGTYQTWSSSSTLTTKDYGPQTYTVDISSLSGEYYVYWDCSLQAQYSSSSDGWPGVNFTLNEIYLE